MESKSPLFGVSGLSPRIQNLARGMVYALIADQPSIRIPLLARSIVRSIEADVPCILLSPTEPSAWVKKARLAGVELAGHVRRGTLRIYRPLSDETQALSLERPAQVTAAINKIGVEPGSLLVVDQADGIFQLADPRFAGAASGHFQNWVEEKNFTMLAAFAPSVRAPRDYVTLRSLAENLAGFVVVRNGPEDAQIEFRHWFGAKGPNPRTNYGLRFDDAGQLIAQTVGRGPSGAVDTVMEVEVATHQSMSDFVSGAHGWKGVNDGSEAMDVIREHAAGSIILHFSTPAEFRSLCQTVAAIRALGKPQWRVIIRERGARLRIPHVVALMRLGTSLIIPESTDATSARLIAEAFRGTLFTRGVEIRVDTVLDDLNGLESRSHKDPSEFRIGVERLMAAGSEFDIPHTLVKLGLGRISGERIGASLSRRSARDMLLTESDGSMWVFFFGCPSEQVESVLSRLLGKNFDRLFDGWVRITKTQDILLAISQLDGADRAGDSSASNVIELPLRRSA